MPKYLNLIFLFFTVYMLQSCSSTKRGAAVIKNPAPNRQVMVFSHDSIVYDNRVVAQPVSYATQISGNWRVVTMRRQQKAELELLNGVGLSFDTTQFNFTGKAPCNNIGGKFILNGTSIRFQDIFSTKMACDRLEQENYYLRLLNERVSAFTIINNKLLLRDVSSNIVFECER